MDAWGDVSAQHARTRAHILHADTACKLQPMAALVALHTYAWCWNGVEIFWDEKDKKMKLWGLNRCTWRDGRTVFLCDEHMAESP